MVHAQSLHKPVILLRSKNPSFTFLPGPLEAAGFQPFIQQNESVSLPIHGLDFFPASAAEAKERVGERIQVELPLDQGGQFVNSTAQIGVTTGDVCTVGSLKLVSATSASVTPLPRWLHLRRVDFGFRFSDLKSDGHAAGATRMYRCHFCELDLPLFHDHLEQFPLPLVVGLRTDSMSPAPDLDTLPDATTL